MNDNHPPMPAAVARLITSIAAPIADEILRRQVAHSRALKADRNRRRFWRRAIRWMRPTDHETAS